MKSRKYINRIDVYKKTEVADGFGGDVYGDPELIASSWCRIKTLSPERLTDLGLQDFKYGISIDLRYRTDLDYNQKDIYFSYKSRDYIIQSVIDKDLEGKEIKIIATSL